MIALVSLDTPSGEEVLHLPCIALCLAIILRYMVTGNRLHMNVRYLDQALRYKTDEPGYNSLINSPISLWGFGGISIFFNFAIHFFLTVV